ncbi:permease-like cell division protein FtsX [Nonomuraea sp. GTA35]|uniref:permease-like cell division protein FtsX n=1 Tax=Nonomuraea sp. GTA35 TaxID=1676746 RepID=UPI0035BFCC67
MVTAAAAVVVVGSATAVLVGGGAVGGGDGGRVTAATAADVFTQGEADMTVFLCTATAPKDSRCAGAADAGQREAIERVVEEQLPQIAAGQWVSQAVAYDAFRKRYAHNQALLDEVEAADLPPSYRLKLRQGADRRQVASAFQQVAGVSAVVDHASGPAAEVTAQERKWEVSAFLCKAGTRLPACQAKPADRKKGDSKTTEAGMAATPAQTKAVRRLIQRMPEVEKFSFEDEATAYENFKEAFKDNEKLLRATRVEDMPESFRIKLKADAAVSEVVDVLKRQPGVAQVTSNQCVADRAALYTEFGLQLPDGVVCPAGG